MPRQQGWDQNQDDRSTRPIAYASRTLQPHEKRYFFTEMEGLGVVWAITVVHVMVSGKAVRDIPFSIPDEGGARVWYVKMTEGISRDAVC